MQIRMQIRMAMGFALLGSLALAGCGALSSSKKTPPPAPTGSFTTVNGWAPLTWDMNVDQAQAALGNAGIAFTREDRSYYAFAEAQAIDVPRDPGGDPGGPEARQPPRDPYDERVIEEDQIEQRPHTPMPPPRIAPVLLLQFAAGWTGQVVFGPEGLMREVTLTSPELATQDEANGALVDHQRRFGPPTNTPVTSGQSVEYDWVNARTALAMWIWQDPNTTRWHVIERYSRLN